MEEILDNFWSGSTFMPHDQKSKIDKLLQKVFEKREIDLIALCLKIISSEPLLCKETGFLNQFDRVKNLEPREIIKLIKNPIYISWFKQTSRIQNNELILRKKLREFSHVLDTTLKVNAISNELLVDEQAISIQRFEVDPIILEIAFPEYKLPDAGRQKIFEQDVIYPETFFREMLEIALERIKLSWTEAYVNFPKFVKIIVDMIDGDYTSYSSADHTGAIFVSTDNSPLVALEEFLIHEFGHQILYHIMELDPIVTDTDKTVYKLPWSGNKRDFYGYFHAFYIYILMATYLTKVKNRSRREQHRIQLRKIHIMKGLEQTVKTFDQTDNFTICGKHLFNNLKLEIEKLRQVNIFT